jgi:MFS family permease
MLEDTNVPILVFHTAGAPAIQIDRAGWLVTGYLLGYVAVLPLMGAVSDAYGRRQVLLGALAIFAAGSLGVALAQSLTVLVLARTVQALGGGALLPVALAAAADLVAPWQQGLVLGAIAAAAELGGVCGPIYGAFITQHTDLGWRLIFWLNLPIVAVLALPTLLLPARRRARAVDYRGGFILGAAVAGLVVAAVGYWLLRGWLVTPPHAPDWTAPGLAGLGTGLVAAPVTTAALSVARHDQGGVLASLVTAARVAGMMAGLSTIASWGSWRFQVLAATIRRPQVSPHSTLKDLQHIAAAYGLALQRREIVVLQDIFVALSLICALAILPAVLLGSRQRSATRGQPAAAQGPGAQL